MKAPDRPLASARHRTGRAILACAVTALAGTASQAQPTQAAQPASQPAGTADVLPLWEVGFYPVAGWQPAYPGSDEHLTKGAVLPYAIWRGPVLRLENGVVGLRGGTPRVEWDVSGSGAFGASANEVKARAGMPAIGTLVEVGPSVRLNIGDWLDAARAPRDTRLEWPLRAVFDASDGLAHKGWTLEPRLTHVLWRGADWSLVAGGSLLFADRALANLYYGVAPAYAAADRPAYDGRAGLLSGRLDLWWRKRLTSRVRMQWFIEGETVRGAANESSPLVRRREDIGVGVSFTWAAWISSEPGSD